MTFRRTELRAFPRLQCGVPASLRLDDLMLEGQVIDISPGGCKFLPIRLAELVAADYQPGVDGMLRLDRDLWHPVVMRWATPNYSALGCAFQPAEDIIPFAAGSAFDQAPALAI